MARKILLMLVSGMIVLLSQGCFSELPVHKYTVKQQTPAAALEPSQAKPAKAEPPKTAYTTPPAAMGKAEKTTAQMEKPKSSPLEDLGARIDALSKRLDLQEKRTMELERRLQPAK